MAVTLSIVMPVFNHPDLVQVMVESIRANDFQEWELWAVDDGSSEECVQLLAAKFSVDSRIHYVKRDCQPKGAQTCRNIGLEKARGEFILFLDSDDKIEPFCLGGRVEALRKRPEMDFMVFPSGVIVENHFTLQVQKYMYGFPLYRDDLDSFARRILPFVVWNNLYRTDSLRKAGVLWDTNLKSLQDADFNLQTMFAGLRYTYAQCPPDMGYRIDTSSSSTSKKVYSGEHQESILYAIDKFYRMYQSRFGHLYDYQLYRGVLYLYNFVMTDGMIPDFAEKMSSVVLRYSWFYGRVMKSQIWITSVLQFFMPSKRARQIPMAGHLIDYGRRMKAKKREIIKLLAR